MLGVRHAGRKCIVFCIWCLFEKENQLIGGTLVLGNFTQMVWKSSKQVGVGLATSGRGTFIAVAFYDPAGNITNPGYFHDNVKTKGSTL